ncbi:EF-hand domain-containing protein [Streptomyces sp. NPDC059104]|uniref:EF-hand domain-containing protein n=1 Tax=Streptomyces sp. NPDC059104 TaxID=3346729 RepID=UPI0036BAF98B
MDTATSLIAKRHIFTVLDVDGDGMISRHEYLSRPERVAVARTAHERVFALMDADGDRAGDRAESARLREGLGSPADDAGPAFDALDEAGGGHGRVGRDACLASNRSYVTQGTSRRARHRWRKHRTRPPPAETAPAASRRTTAAGRAGQGQTRQYGWWPASWRRWEKSCHSCSSW